MIVGLLIALFAGIWVGSDANKRGMNGFGWGIFSFAILIIGLPMYLIERKKHPILNIKNTLNNNIISESNTTSSPSTIPETCPHCKNPNTKLIRLCEWCGNQIV
jgi:hypothetical protein